MTRATQYGVIIQIILSTNNNKVSFFHSLSFLEPFEQQMTGHWGPWFLLEVIFRCLARIFHTKKPKGCYLKMADNWSAPFCTWTIITWLSKWRPPVVRRYTGLECPPGPFSAACYHLHFLIHGRFLGNFSSNAHRIRSVRRMENRMHARRPHCGLGHNHDRRIHPFLWNRSLFVHLLNLCIFISGVFILL